MTDPRIIRTREALQSAALELAMADRPLTVAAIAETAHVNRATFYDHYDSPQAAVLEALSRDLDELRESDTALRDSDELPRAVIFKQALAGVVQHILKFEALYRRSLANPADGVTHHALSSHFAGSVRLIIARQPPHPNRPDPEVAAEFIAHGLVGALEVWLATPGLDETTLVESIRGCMPVWWDNFK